jgi:exodeoxyribonuclease V gamma subunit
MLRILRSNRVEILLAQLADRLVAQPLSSPFAREIVVAPSPAMGRWTQIRLAQALGLAAHVDYPLPAVFVWQLCHRLLDDVPDADPLALERLTWRIFASLPDCLADPAFAPLARYLSDDPQHIKRLQLSGRIADAFDRYQYHRPRLIRGWSAGDGSDWQALLWRRITADMAGQHRVALIQRLLEALKAGPRRTNLPERASLFAVSTLPPLLVEVFHALSAHLPVDLYLHAPTPHFWADLVSRKSLARRRLESPADADVWEVGHDLLSSWGRQGQALQDLLLEPETPLEEVDAFVKPWDSWPADRPLPLLLRLQRDIYLLRDATQPDQRERLSADDTVQVHVCHSPLRECQELHDQLLRRFDTDRELRPEDILVMVPEIATYAPFIDAVFSRDTGHDRPHIPWNLSDTTVRDEHPLVTVFLQLLALPDSRFPRSEILACLDIPELAQRFRLDAEAVAWVRGWLDTARTRWAFDGAHKTRLGLPGTEENTWVQAGQRLFGGYALGDTDLFDGIAPIGGLDGARAEALGRFWHLLSTLESTAGDLSQPRSVADWQQRLTRLLADFFVDHDDDASPLQRIRDAIADFAEQAGDLTEPLALPLVRHWLSGRLETAGQHGRYFSGGVTFCGMRPMRSLPFRVICILGLHDLAFPRRDRPADFDRMRDHQRPSDPRKADEDRYLFLETLLCARHGLHLSYVGRDIRTNAERQPSVLLRELLDHIDRQYRPASGDDSGKVSDHLTRVHALQPFNPKAYAPGQQSYDSFWCDVADTLRQPESPEPGTPSGQKPRWNPARLGDAPDRMRDISLQQLDRFVRHPMRYFVNSRFQLWLREDEDPDDTELFTLDRLEAYAIRELLAKGILEGRPATEARLGSEGRLPHAGFANLTLQAQTDSLSPLLARLAAFAGKRPLTLPLSLRLNGTGPRQLEGEVTGVYPCLGLLRWRAGQRRGEDIRSLWLHHLAWCVAEPDVPQRRSVLHTVDGDFILQRDLSPAEARAALESLLDRYWEGVHRPLLLPPRASFA